METKKETKRYYLCYRIGKSNLLNFVNFSKNEEGKYVIGKEDIIHDGDPLRGKKYTLAEIDEFTNSFDSCKDFFNTVSPYLSYGDLDENNFQIKYNQEGIKTLRTIFGNKELREKTEMVSNSTIIDPEEINSFVDLLINGSNQFVWNIYDKCNSIYKGYDIDLNFLKCACEIRRDFKFVTDMKIDGEFIKDKEKRLGSMLSKYKTYREVFTFKQDYEKSLEKPKTKKIESKKEDNHEE